MNDLSIEVPRVITFLHYMVGFVFFPVTSARKFILVDKPIW